MLLQMTFYKGGPNAREIRPIKSQTVDVKLNFQIQLKYLTRCRFPRLKWTNIYYLNFAPKLVLKPSKVNILEF